MKDVYQMKPPTHRLYHCCEIATEDEWVDTEKPVFTLCGLQIEGNFALSWDFVRDFLEDGPFYSGAKKCEKCEQDDRLPLLMLSAIDKDPLS